MNRETSVDIDVCVVIYFGIWSRADLIMLVEHNEVNLLILGKQLMRKWEWLKINCSQQSHTWMLLQLTATPTYWKNWGSAQVT